MSYTPCQCYTVTHKYTIGHFDEWLAIHQVFPYKPLSLNVSPLKPNPRSICQSFTCQAFVNDSFVKNFPHQTFML